MRSKNCIMKEEFVNMEIRGFLIFLLCSGALGCQYAHYLHISVPKLEALSGSCLLIPCEFTLASPHTLDLSQPVVAIWSKTYFTTSSDNVHNFFNSGMPSLRSPMKMIGDLKRQNCTTLFSDLNTTHSDKYYFRVENGQTRPVSINCSALTPCPHSPPKLTWNLQQEPPQNLVQNPDGTFSTSIQHSLTLSDKHHGLEVICAAEYPGTGGHRRAQTTLPLSVDCKHDCSSRAWPPVHSFSWFRVSSQGPQRVHGGQIYSFIFNSTTQESTSVRPRIKSDNRTLQLSNYKVHLSSIFLCLVSCFKKKTPPETQTEIYEEVHVQEDSVLYGEVVFTQSATKKPAATVQRTEEPEETIYSQVRVSKAAGSQAQPTEELYATVKKS
ncbi:hypothetical protein WMY93_009228 [Mugilogobius chulae]|uniref:Ig-like domain-containing protein n=1 Tax=Mugilogobius chulae TaxID=88201 RepID=A0AAW0PC79_9GOBI